MATTTHAVVPQLKRVITLGMQGADVRACKRAAARAGFPHQLLAGITSDYSAADVQNIKAFQAANHVDVDGAIGEHTFAALLPHMDALALQIYESFAGTPSGTLDYPHPDTWHGPAPTESGLHQTAGLAGNWALDFMAEGGTQVLAPEAGTIFKLSGHDPATGVHGADIFGWNVYVHTPAGLLYFMTHLGDRGVQLGESVNAGDIIGHVGHWPNDPGRSHTHLGVTDPAGIAAAKDRICQVAESPRVAGQMPQ
jgi:murein DD-endopeptidase MepM/ murein hydrolase activator NlpD